MKYQIFKQNKKYFGFKYNEYFLDGNQMFFEDKGKLIELMIDPAAKTMFFNKSTSQFLKNKAICLHQFASIENIKNEFPEYAV